ncbi:MAG TPA: hypothetical protein VFI41_12685 [Gemmatimonadales bacterium]|nr:hypothetical protein [Gemmatimonadales bacterium]
MPERLPAGLEVRLRLGTLRGGHPHLAEGELDRAREMAGVDRDVRQPDGPGTGHWAPAT